MVDSTLFLEEVKKIAKNQFKIETARKERIENLEKDNVRLREETDILKRKIRDCEEKSRKRQAMIKDLRVVNSNAKNGLIPNTQPVEHKAVISPDNSYDVKKRAEVSRKAPLQQISTDSTIVAQAKANTASRNEVSNPCHWARSGRCRYGSACRSSHNVLPVDFCPAYNAMGHCGNPKCHLQHSLYFYNGGVEPSLARPTDQTRPQNQARFDGNRTPPQYISAAKWK